MKFLSFTTLLDNDVALSEVQQISGSRLLGNATGSTANVSQISLGAGLEFSGSTLRVNSSIPVASGTCQFLGVITPATDMYVYKDNVPNSRLNTPTGILRVLYFKLGGLPSNTYIGFIPFSINLMVLINIAYK